MTNAAGSSGQGAPAAAGAGLRGAVAGETALCTVGKSGAGLTYRGYGIDVLAEKATFEEVAFLLLRGKLPNRSELAGFAAEVKGSRGLPAGVKRGLEILPSETAPMDVMRTGVSLLGGLEPERDFSEQGRVSVRLLGALPSMLLYWWQFANHGLRIETATEDESIAGHFLRMLKGKEPSALEERVMNVSLILYAEHEFNASTFTARVVASTLSDLYSCVTAAIGALKGPLHGGANEAAMAMLERFGSEEEAERVVMGMLGNKSKIMGFGHAIYRESDPRSAIIQKWAEELSAEASDGKLYKIAVRVAEVLWREKKLFPNADFYHAPAYHFLGIPTELFTPIFVISRVTGWCGHVMEQRAKNRIIRPSAEYTGPMQSEWVDLDQRG